MNTKYTNDIIKELTNAIGCLNSALQMYPMDTQIRMEIHREIRCLYAIIDDIVRKTLEEGKE